MSWDNYGEWVVDHKKPIAAFNIVDAECQEFRDCWKLENLQPMFFIPNLQKGAKYDFGNGVFLNNRGVKYERTD